MSDEQPPAPGDFADQLVGRLLDGRYRVTERVARGGMASIYRAIDLRLDREVAVKVMHPGLAEDRTFADRFVREARAAARLSHPHVVSVFDQGTDGDVLFLAMEYVPGRTLRDVIRDEAPMRPLRALTLLKPVLQALSHAHKSGLVHRDVKPENVLIGTDGSIKVADFGLARAVSADTQHTATGGVLIGTVSYLAPELVVEGRIDPRVDVYAVGVLLYELLTGAKPHEGDTPIQIAYAHVHTDVPAPSLRVPGLPDYVDALVARATARDRTLRPADASVLLRYVNLVGQALSEGVESDADLVSDLRPMSPHPSTGELVTTDEAPDPYDTADLTQLREPRESPVATPAATEEVTQQLRTPGPPPPRHPGPAPRRRRRGLLVLLAALVLALVVGAGAWWFGWARYTITPGVLGLDQAAATSKLKEAGLEVALGDPAFSESVPTGHVVSTEPGRGEKILDHGTVSLVLSKGKERYQVPALGRLDLVKAEDALRATNLTIGSTSEKFSEKVAEGQVIRSDPRRGTELRRGDKVNLVLSKGRKPFPIKDWTGKDADKAKAALSKHFTVTIGSEQYSDTVADGAVISQTPAGGTGFRGDTITLSVSKGRELIEIPNLRATGVDSATKKLEGLGFKVRTEHDTVYLGLGYVSRSSPGFGQMARKGSTITLYLV